MDPNLMNALTLVLPAAVASMLATRYRIDLRVAPGEFMLRVRRRA